MAKHRKQSTGSTRRVATTAAVAASATLTTPIAAQAAEVVIPNTDLSFRVDGIENIPGIENVPGIENYVPSLAGKVTEQSVNNFAAGVGAPQVVAAPAEPSTGEKVVAAARAAMGAPYVWGAAGPSSFDCSGLTSWSYAQAGVKIPRTSYAQAAQGQRIALADIQPGDIVVYYSGASHVGIYAGNGMIIDALTSGTPVGERPLQYMPIHSIVRF